MGFDQEQDFDLDEIRQLLKDKEQPAAKTDVEDVPKAESVRREQKEKSGKRVADLPKKKSVRRDPAMEALRENQRDAQDTEVPKGFDTFAIFHDVAAMLAIITLVFVFFFRLVAVSGSSMYSTFVDRDWLILESNFLYREVKRGDVVVLNVESSALEGPIVKRVIATEGQTVDIDFETGSVYVDGKLQIEPYAYEPTYLGNAADYPLTVPDGCIFVMGDNRNNSFDSRSSEIGCVPTERVLGKALLIVFPGRETDSYGDITGKRDFSRIGVVS